MIKASGPDMVLLDVRMPVMDGLEVLRVLRKSPSTRSLPVIFLTGTILDVDELVAALELDPSDFVTKGGLIERTRGPGQVGSPKRGLKRCIRPADTGPGQQ